MPSLAQSLALQTVKHGGPSCQLCDAIPSLNKEDANTLKEALENPRLAGTMIARALDDYGVTVSIATLRRHRRKECSAFHSVG
jgi:hypothetical protein